MTTRREWSRRMGRRAVALLVLGLVLLLVGSFMTGGQGDPMQGVLVGSAGVLAITFGALMGRYATAGPFPRDLGDGPAAGTDRPSGRHDGDGGDTGGAPAGARARAGPDGPSGQEERP